ncbi:SMG7-like protein [Tanacetum coccineum]
MLEDAQISDTNLLTHPSSQCSAVTGSLYGEGAPNPRDFATAATYYKQAATLWPSSGNPHHQLAILASYSGDVLSGLGFNQCHAPEALGYGQDVLHLHVGTRVLRSDMLSCPDQLSSKDQVEGARTTVLNQEIKHILKDVLLTKMKISSMARPFNPYTPQDEPISTNKRAKAAEIFSDLEVVYRYRLELYMQCLRLEMYVDRHFIFPLPSLHRICVVLKMVLATL